MPASRLTVRTLCLATVALVLACGHAARAMGTQRATPDRAVSKPTTPARTIRVVPAGSGQSTVATFSNTGRGGGRSAASRVATFTSTAGSSSSIATFSGDRVLRQASAATHRTPPARTKPRAKLLPKGEAPVIAVRRAGAKADVAAPTGSSSDAAPVSSVETTQPTKSARPAMRNAFGGLSSAAASETTRHAPLVYAQAYAGSR